MARVRVVEHIAEGLSKGVDLTPLPLDPEIRRLAREVMGIETP